MRVTLCVDALSPQLSGIGRYTLELAKGLAKCDEISDLRFYRDHSLVADPMRLLSGDAHHTRRSRLLRRLDRWKTQRTLRSTLVHGPNYFLPSGVEAGVITVHDLSVFRYPETHPTARVQSFERLFSSSLSRAAHVITDSETVSRELIDTFAVPPGMVSTVYLGVGAAFRPRDERELAGVLSRWGLEPGRYGLSVAAFEPRKKLAELIASWGRLPASLRNRYPLVLAGSPGWRNEELHGDIKTASAAGWLKYVGFVDEASLPYLYAGARSFVYPSTYEGFGLPPVEAMASGTPVLVSNRSCLPEVCGDAARFIDPDDSDSLTAAIEQSLCDEQGRAETSRRGIERARSYSWDRCIANTVAVYRTASASIDHCGPC